MASKGLHGSIGPGGSVGMGSTPWPKRQWERAPWWARLFGYQWRKVLYEASPYDDAIYTYQTNKQRAKALLEERYGDQENQQGPSANYIVGHPQHFGNHGRQAKI